MDPNFYVLLEPKPKGCIHKRSISLNGKQVKILVSVLGVLTVAVVVCDKGGEGEGRGR